MASFPFLLPSFLSFILGVAIASARQAVAWQDVLTGLDVGTLLLVFEELADLGLVLVVELVQVEVLDGVLRGVHDDGL